MPSEIFISVSHARFELRTLRRKSGLSQEELASLLPRAGRKKVICIEGGMSVPNAAQILAYEVIFGLPAHELFRALYTDSEEAVMQAAYALHRRLEPDSSALAARKREFLEVMLARATSRSNRNAA